MTGFEPVASSLPRKCSTPEPHQQVSLIIDFHLVYFFEDLYLNFCGYFYHSGAGEGTRTLDPQLGRLTL